MSPSLPVPSQSRLLSWLVIHLSIQGAKSANLCSVIFTRLAHGRVGRKRGGRIATRGGILTLSDPGGGGGNRTGLDAPPLLSQCWGGGGTEPPCYPKFVGAPPPAPKTPRSASVLTGKERDEEHPRDEVFIWVMCLRFLKKGKREARGVRKRVSRGRKKAANK